MSLQMFASACMHGIYIYMRFAIQWRMLFFHEVSFQLPISAFTLIHLSENRELLKIGMP